MLEYRQFEPPASRNSHCPCSSKYLTAHFGVVLKSFPTTHKAKRQRFAGVAVDAVKDVVS